MLKVFQTSKLRMSPRLLQKPLKEEISLSMLLKLLPRELNLKPSQLRKVFVAQLKTLMLSLKRDEELLEVLLLKKNQLLLKEEEKSRSQSEMLLQQSFLRKLPDLAVSLEAQPLLQLLRKDVEVSVSQL